MWNMRLPVVTIIAGMLETVQMNLAESLEELEISKRIEFLLKTVLNNQKTK